uniref:Ubiquitin-like domain-containing protein n=1 Tax=Alexandrium monilatum TaxID=311494 RepID=A0A7S4QTR7_9DINO
MAGTGERAVVVLTPAGGHFTARVSPGDTTWTLKERLEVDVGRPARSMRLIQGEEVLEDEWALLERGLADGARLTLVLSDLPVGTFELRPRNAGASVLAVFESTGRVAVQVHESERTSDSEDEHYDPYARRAAWAQCYFGSCRQGTAGKLVIAVSHCARPRRARVARRSQRPVPPLRAAGATSGPPSRTPSSVPCDGRFQGGGAPGAACRGVRGRRGA